MKNIIYAVVCLIFISCSKDRDPGNITKDPNNHMEAIVTFSSGSSISINETGQNVTMGIGIYGEVNAEVIDNQNRGIVASTSDYDGNNLNECYGSYYPNGFYNTGGYNNGHIVGDTVIYTIISGTHREGNFHFTCTNGAGDTARITGSFKGRFGY